MTCPVPIDDVGGLYQAFASKSGNLAGDALQPRDPARY
jgi:hypothetical protein